MEQGLHPPAMQAQCASTACAFSGGTGRDLRGFSISFRSARPRVGIVARPLNTYVGLWHGDAIKVMETKHIVKDIIVL